MSTFRILCIAAVATCGACKPSPSPTPSQAPAPSASAASPPPPVPSPSSARVALPFEGEIQVAVKAAGAAKVPPAVTFDVKGERVRYQAANSTVRALADVSAREAFAVSDARKSFTDVDAKPRGSAVATTDPTIRKSEFSQKVAGVACDDWTIDDGTERVEICAAKGIPFFDLALAPKAGKAEPGWAAALTHEKAFPLSIVAYDEAGKELYRAEATRVDARKLDDATFRVPTGFKAADLSADMRTASLP